MQPKTNPVILVLSMEILATIFLVLLGCGTIVAASKENAGGSTSVQYALGFGLAYLVTLATFAPFSGAIVNPALVLAMAVTKRMRPAQALFYIIAESNSLESCVYVSPLRVYFPWVCGSRASNAFHSLFDIILVVIGAIIGAAILDSVTGRTRLGSLGVTALGEQLSDGDGFGMEFVLGFIYVLGVFSFANPDKILDGSLGDQAHRVGALAAVLVFFAVRLYLFFNA
jgi:glycerol uptake facilitator-like aquaporin